VAQFLDRWLTVIVTGTVAAGTSDDYAHTVRLHLKPALGRKRLSQHTVADVDALWGAKRSDGYKPNSVRIMRAVLRKALAQAEREGLISRNVAALSQAPRIAQPEGGPYQLSRRSRSSTRLGVTGSRRRTSSCSPTDSAGANCSVSPGTTSTPAPTLSPYGRP
jgi:hypothetical protein